MEMGEIFNAWDARQETDSPISEVAAEKFEPDLRPVQ